jgi:hypothetical protein
MYEVPAVIRNYFAGLAAERGTRGPIGEVLALLSAGVYDFDALEELIRRHGVRREEWFRTQVLDLLIGYVMHAAQDGRLTDEQIENTRTLRRFLGVQQGEFGALRPAEVSNILQGQLEIILFDGRIDSSEDLYQVELQALFDLSYDEYLTLARPAIERAWTDLNLQASGEGPAALAAARLKVLLAPLYGLTQAQKRSLGQLY